MTSDDRWRNQLTFSFTIRFKGDFNSPKAVERMNKELNWKQYTNRLVYIIQNGRFAENCKFTEMSIYNFGELVNLPKERLTTEDFEELFCVDLTGQSYKNTPAALLTQAYNQAIDHSKSGKTYDQDITIMFKVAFNEQFCDFYDLVKSMKPVIGWTNTFAYILCQYADRVNGINIVHGRYPIKSSDDTVTIVSCGFDSGKNPINGSKAMLWTMAEKMYPDNEYYCEQNRKIFVEGSKNTWLLQDDESKFLWLSHLTREMKRDTLFDWRIVGYDTSIRGTYNYNREDNYAQITVYIRNIRDKKKNTVKDLTEHLTRIIKKLTKIEVQQILSTIGDQGINFFVVYMTEPEQGLEALSLPTGHPRSLNKKEYSFVIEGVGFPCDVDILDNTKEYRLFRNSNLTNPKAEHPFKVMSHFIDQTNNNFYKIEDLVEKIQGDNWTLPNVPEIKSW